MEQYNAIHSCIPICHTLYRDHAFLTHLVIFKPIAYIPLNPFHVILASIISYACYLISINLCKLKGGIGLIIGIHGQLQIICFKFVSEL
jgi:hypothetical protein